jgi:hypothetical protein
VDKVGCEALSGHAANGALTQGGARPSLALGWLVKGLWPSLVLRPSED